MTKKLTFFRKFMNKAERFPHLFNTEIEIKVWELKGRKGMKFNILDISDFNKRDKKIVAKLLNDALNEVLRYDLPRM